MTPDDPRHMRPESPDDGAPAAWAPADGADVDGLASALLDGALDAEAEAAARRRPDVLARLADMAAARDALRSLPPPDAAAREEAIAVALAAFERDGAMDLPTRRARRVPHRLAAPRWLGAAAVAALLVAAAASLALIQPPGGDDARDSNAATQAMEESGQDTAAADAPERGTTSGADAAPAPGEVGDLGSFATDEELAAAARARLGDGARQGTTSADEGEQDAASGGDGQLGAPAPDAGNDGFAAACGTDPPWPLGADAAVTLHGRAVLAGQVVEVFVVRAADGQRIVALDPASCAVVVDQPLE